jgi:NitT/TauT family transport system substrate-binding protein
MISACGGAVLADAVSGCDWMPDQPIAVAAHVWLGYEPLFLAQREAWLDAKAAQVVQTVSAAESLQALAQGRVQGAALTLDEMLLARAAGYALSAVLVFNVSAGADMLLVRSDILTLDRLKGRRIGYEQSSVGMLLLAKILELAGLTERDVIIRPMRVDTHVRAWESREVDALITYEPVGSQLLSLGAVRLFDTRQLPNTIVDVLAMRSDALDASHAKAVRHLIATHFWALDRLRRNPQDTAYRMADHLGLASAGVLAAFKGLLIPDIDNNHRLLDGVAPALQDAGRLLSDAMVKGKLLKQSDPLTGLIRADFLPPRGQGK